MSTGPAADRNLFSRLLLGALSDHEQRLLVVRLLRCDGKMRRELACGLGPFAMLDLDLARAYDDALASGGPVDGRRRALLAEAAARHGDLDGLVERFTVEDAFTLGAATRQLFSWTVAEHLLARARRSDGGAIRAKVALHLAMMVVDGLEILGLAGHAPRLDALVGDLRERIEVAAAMTAAS